MDSFFTAFIEFITDIFSAIAEFLGWTIYFEELPNGSATDEEKE